MTTYTNSAGQLQEEPGTGTTWTASDGSLQDGLPGVGPFTNAAGTLLEGADRLAPYTNSAGQLMGAAAFRDTPGYDPAAVAFFARLTTQPTDARKGLYNTLIKDLKAASVWAKLDALYILAAADAQAARQNLVADAYNLTAVGSPAFTADRGYAGDAAGAYLLGASQAEVAAMTNYKLDDAGAFVGVETAGTTASAVVGQSTGTANFYLNLRATTNPTGLAQARMNTTSGLSSGVFPRTGFMYGGTLGPTQQEFSRDGAARISGARAVTGLPAGPISILRHLTAYADDRVKFFGMGAALSTSEEAALISALNTYTTAIGAA